MYALDFEEIQSQIRDMAQKFAEEEIAPSVIERDINSEFPLEILKKMGELGFMGMMVPPEYNGSGLEPISYVLALSEIAKVDASVSTIMSVQNSLINWILEHYGTEEQKENYLKKTATGEYLGAYCLSEPEAGSDARGIRTMAVKEGDEWIINGTKNWISTGQHADVFIVFAQTNPELKHKGIACFLMEKGTPGLEPGLKEDKMGLRCAFFLSRSGHFCLR